MPSQFISKSNKLIFRTLCACIICCVCIANSYEEQRKADKATLAHAIAEARQEARNAAASRDVQKAIIEEEVQALVPHVPRTAITEIKAPAVMKASAKVRG